MSLLAKLPLKKIDPVFVAMFLARGIQSVLIILTLRLMTEALDKSEVGQYYYINSIIYWFSIVLINPVGMYVNRHLHQWQKLALLGQLLKKLNIYFASVGILAAVIVFIFYNKLFNNQSLNQIALLLYILCYLYLSTWFQSINSFFNILNHQKIFLTLMVLSQFLGLVIAYFLVRHYQSNAIVWLSGILIGQAISLIIAVIFFYKKEIKSNKSSYFSRHTFFNRDLLYFTVPIAIATAFMWIQNQGYRIYIENKFGLEVLAGVAVGLGISAGISSSFEQIIMQYYYPGYYKKISDANKVERKLAWEELWKKCAAWYFISALLIITTSPITIRIFASAEYINSYKYIMIGAVIDLFRQLTNLIYLIAHSEKNTKYNILPYALGALFLVVFTVIASSVNYFNVNIFMFCLGFSFFVTFLIMLYYAKKQLNVRLMNGY